MSTTPRDRIRSVYSPALFEASANQFTQLLKQYFERIQNTPSALPWRNPNELLAKAQAMMDRTPAGYPDAVQSETIANRMGELAKLFLDTNNPLHSPHYMGHQVAPSVPVVGLFEMLGSSTNEASGIYEMGPLPNAVERALVAKLGSYIGWKTDFDGISTHGGTIANLTAILAARNIKIESSWHAGVAEAAKKYGQPAIITSDDSHYSIARAAAIAGIGEDHVISAPIDDRRRIRVDALERLLAEAKAQGKNVFCIVGTSGTTPTGSFDPLDQIGDFAAKYGLWFHVDAAHGGGTLMSKKHRQLLKGIDKADSVTWDAHKMMFVPALSTFLFFKEKKNSYLAFHQDAPYLWDTQSNPTLEFDSAVRTMECTKRPLMMALWSMWCTFGPQIFEDLIEVTFQNTWDFYEMLEETEDFEPMHEPQCNILCFRYLPKNLTSENLSELQTQIRRKLIENGNFYITATRLDGSMCLRVTLMNPLTEKIHLEGLLNAIREIVRK